MFYTLDGQIVIQCDVLTFERDLRNQQKREIDRTIINSKKTTVVTLFTGLNHNLIDDDDPLYFETVVFGGVYDGQAFRSSTYDEAKTMHNLIVARVKDQKRVWYQ